jgi:hypothetical protein
MACATKCLTCSLIRLIIDDNLSILFESSSFNVLPEGSRIEISLSEQGASSRKPLPLPGGFLDSFLGTPATRETDDK